LPAFLLIALVRESLNVSRHLKRVLAIWFTMQIVLPFTAPVHLFDLGDILGTNAAHSPFGIPAPVTSEAETNAGFVSPLDASVLRASESLLVPARVFARGPFDAVIERSHSPRDRRAVLRL
jgi:hypothetical protein